MAQAIPLGLMAAGTAVGAAGTIIGANDQAKALRSEAAQYDARAQVERASSQRRMIEEKRQGRLAQSRALAVAASSGGGASDPTVVNLIANLEGDSEYRALTALYEGEEAAKGMEAQASARRSEAKNVKKAALFKAGSQILSTGSTMFDRFGGDGPSGGSNPYGIAASDNIY